MAREILFQGKRKDNGEWVEGQLFVGFGKTYICPEATALYFFDGALCLGGFIEVISETVGQFSGLTDKNGKRIFEGYIAKYTNKDGTHTFYETPAFYEVVWDNEFSALMFRLIGGWSGVFMAGMNEWVEVVGNIHDNPELLDGTES